MFRSVPSCSCWLPALLLFLWPPCLGKGPAAYSSAFTDCITGVTHLLSASGLFSPCRLTPHFGGWCFYHSPVDLWCVNGFMLAVCYLRAGTMFSHITCCVGLPAAMGWELRSELCTVLFRRCPHFDLDLRLQPQGTVSGVCDADTTTTVITIPTVRSVSSVPWLAVNQPIMRLTMCFLFRSHFARERPMLLQLVPWW